MLKVFCATLGCDKNLVDSEALLGRFARDGVQPVDDPDVADIWVLNSCGFIDAARADSEETLRDIRGTGVEILTIGQYLQPTSAHLPVDRWVHPEEFESYRRFALSLGFEHCESGPLVRSSYHAHEHVAAAG